MHCQGSSAWSPLTLSLGEALESVRKENDQFDYKARYDMWPAKLSCTAAALSQQKDFVLGMPQKKSTRGRVRRGKKCQCYTAREQAPQGVSSGAAAQHARQELEGNYQASAGRLGPRPERGAK